MSRSRIAYAAVGLLLAALVYVGQATRAPDRDRPARPNARAPQVPRSRPSPQAAPGDFAYYVLALSWSPQHCATTGGRDPQCSGPRRFGFVAHGLWPQHERGWPESCGEGPLADDLVQRMMDIMPSSRLIRHEWEKHGTCSGLSAAEYFDKVREAFAEIRIPPSFQGPSATVTTTPAKFRRAFLDANPALADEGVAVQCSGRYLQEVRVCLDKDLAPRRCSPDVRDRCAGPQMLVRPVR